MKRANLASAALVASVLILSAITVSAASKQSWDQGHQTESYKQESTSNNQQNVSPAFYAAILGTLRAMISEEVAKQKQEHADHEDWSTKPFWITIGLNGLLVLVGSAYTLAA